MINAPVAKSWKHEFAKSAAYRREQELFAKDVERRNKQDRGAERLDNELERVRFNLVHTQLL